jgi:hypothetical protein
LQIAFEKQVKSMPIKGSLTPQSLQSMGPPASDVLQQHWEPLLSLQAGKGCHQPLAEDHTQQDPLKHSCAVGALEKLGKCGERRKILIRKCVNGYVENSQVYTLKISAKLTRKKKSD